MHPNEVLKPTEIEWRPVIVQMREGPVFKVCGPLQAFEIPNRQTIVKSGRRQRHAQQCCRLAMERKCPRTKLAWRSSPRPWSRRSELFEVTGRLP